MRFSTIFTIAGFAAAAVASPLAAPKAAALEARTEARAVDIVGILDTLLNDVEGDLDYINNTLATLVSDSTTADNSTVSLLVNTAIQDITSVVTNVTARLTTLGTTLQDVSAPDVASLIEQLLSETSATLDHAISYLGLNDLVGSTTPLTNALSGLITGLDSVVDNLLSAVKQIVDPTLTGLSTALSGLSL